MQATYQHRQIGWLNLMAAGIVLVVALALLATGDRLEPSPLTLGLALGVPALLAGIFGSLRVEVDAKALRWRMGWLGWPRWELPLSEIVAVSADRQSWMEGWGVRWTLRGMLYSVSGLQTVRVVQRNGKALRIGTDDAQGLLQALQAHLPGPAASSR